MYPINLTKTPTSIYLESSTSVITEMETAAMFDMAKISMLFNQSMSGGGAVAVWSFIQITIIQFIFVFLKEVSAVVSEFVKKWWAQRWKAAASSIVEKVQGIPDPCQLIFDRYYTDKAQPTAYLAADAMIHHISRHPKAKAILVVGNLSTVCEKQVVQIAPDINFELTSLDKDGQDIKHIAFRLFSEKLSTLDIQRYVDNVKQEYIMEKDNCLGTSLYFFDHAYPRVTAFERARSKPSFLRFTKHPFTTNRRFSNIFFEGKDVLEHRFRFFLERKDWYDERGIPYTFGLLFHGSWGTGKTSSIKAIANESQRHILNVNLGQIGSKRLLKKLFFDPVLEVMQPDGFQSQVETYFVPIEKRVYVIEDADCLLGNLLCSRVEKPIQTADAPDEAVIVDEPSELAMTPHTGMSVHSAPFAEEPQVDYDPLAELRSRFVQSKPQQPRQKPKSMNEMVNEAQREMDIEDELDLATVLNCLDGVLETPHRIMILTSNFPEQFDPALIRPGRIDMICEFTKCTRRMIRDLYCRYFSGDHQGMCISDSDLDVAVSKIPELMWSPAEVVQIMMINFNTRPMALQTLADTTPEKFFYNFNIKARAKAKPLPIKQ